MTKISRRRFGVLLGASAAGAAASNLAAPAVLSAPKSRLVVIGGGPGGATAARYVAKAGKDVSVTVIEPKQHFTTCFFSPSFDSGNTAWWE